MTKVEEDIAYGRLFQAIYERAKLDYYEAIITHNNGRRLEVARFFKDDPYYFTQSEGIDIMETLRNNIKEADQFYKDFIELNENEILVPRKYDRQLILMLSRLKYRNISTHVKNKIDRIKGYGYPIYLIKKRGK